MFTLEDLLVLMKGAYYQGQVDADCEKTVDWDEMESTLSLAENPTTDDILVALENSTF